MGIGIEVELMNVLPNLMGNLFSEFYWVFINYVVN